LSIFLRKAFLSMSFLPSNLGDVARPALLVLAVQFASSPLGHIQPAAAQSATAAPFRLMPAEFVDAGSLAVASLSATAADTDQPGCSMCAVATMANTALFAIPPLFLLPQALELLQLSTGAEFVRLRPPRAKRAS
jgi:hypothetical protein